MKELKLSYRQLKIKNKKYKYKFKEYKLPNLTYKAIGGLYYQRDKQRLIVGVLQDESNKILFIDEEDLFYHTPGESTEQPAKQTTRGSTITPEEKATPCYSDEEEDEDAIKKEETACVDDPMLIFDINVQPMFLKVDKEQRILLISGVDNAEIRNISRVQKGTHEDLEIVIEFEK